jgi:hypothetical protein
MDYGKMHAFHAKLPLTSTETMMRTVRRPRTPRSLNPTTNDCLAVTDRSVARWRRPMEPVPFAAPSLRVGRLFDSAAHVINERHLGGIRIVVVRDLAKVEARVRFPYPAPAGSESTPLPPVVNRDQSKKSRPNGQLRFAACPAANRSLSLSVTLEQWGFNHLDLGL